MLTSSKIIHLFFHILLTFKKKFVDVPYKYNTIRSDTINKRCRTNRRGKWKYLKYLWNYVTSKHKLPKRSKDMRPPKNRCEENFT